MSLRRLATVSPLTGCLSKAAPEAVQSFSVPSSKSRLSGLPSWPKGLMPLKSAADTRKARDTEAHRKQSLNAILKFIVSNLRRRLPAQSFKGYDSLLSV